MSLLEIENEILNLVKKYYFLKNANDKIEPGKDVIPVSGKSYNEKEVINLTQSALDFWLTSGRFNKEFEGKLSKFLGIKYVLTTNSGSSSNLLAVSALTSPKLGEKRLLPGDEVITTPFSFISTAETIIMAGAIPVFADISPTSYNLDPTLIEEAISEKTKAIIPVSLYGQMADFESINRIAKKY